MISRSLPLAFLFSILLTFGLKAQLNSSWPDSNARWVNTYYQVSSPVPSLQSVDYYCMEASDTLINSVQYSKISDCLTDYRGAMRDANGKVFYVPKDSAQEYLVYDFTAEVGDTLRDVYMEYGWGGFGLDSLIVAGVDSALYGGMWRKRIQVGSEYWIEGIGNSQGLFRDPYPNISAFQIKLECFSINDTAIYPNSGYGPCNLITNGQNAPDVDVYVSVKDASGNPLRNYNAYVGRGTNLSVQFPQTLFTDSNGEAHTVVSAAPTHSLFAYVFDCHGDTLADFQPAIQKTAYDSVLFEFVVDCPGDTCGIIIRNAVVDKDSGYYQFFFGEIGAGPPRAITPTWTFSDSTLIMDHEPVKQIGPGWTTYCINYGCDTATCDSLYVLPDCSAQFSKDTTGEVFSLWQTYRVSPSSYSFTWDFGDGNTSTLPFPNHTYAQPGNYSVCLTVSYADDSTNCTDTYCENVQIISTGESVQVKDPATIGIMDFNPSVFAVYPNPVDDYLIIEGEQVSEMEAFELYTTNGKLLKIWPNKGEKRLEISLEGIAPGLYLLRPKGAPAKSGRMILKR